MIVQEPEYSKKKILKIKDKYNISDDDFHYLLFNIKIYLLADGDLFNLNKNSK